jgi:class 3 adenylate cyclase/tetratricopeptide (TPR) repeat protein
MPCPKCQTGNFADALFCDECGTPLESSCGRCGETNRRGAKFCKKCGNPLDAALEAATTAKSSAPTSVSHIADRMLASRRFIGGERKRVTVLFADIRGSTSFIEKLDPEEVRKHFDPVLRVMMDAVHRYDGTVNQVLGDGIMALFGAPLAHEDHAVRACYAALAMQEEMRRRAEKNGAGQAASLRIGVGINSGEVVVRSLTNDLNIDYSALGQTTHLAARMEALAAPGAIAITAETLREVEGFVEVRSLGSLQVKGFSSAIEAFELTGVTTARTRLQAAATRGLTPFVGRQVELEFAQRIIGQISGGHGEVLAIVGEAGMGKSRLLQQFLSRYLPAEYIVLEAPSVSYGKATPYFPVIKLLQSYFVLAETEPVKEVRAKVGEHMLGLDPGLSDAIPPILALLDALPDLGADQTAGEMEWLGSLPEVATALMQYTAMEPQERRSSLFSALIRLLLSESRRQPLLLVFEDLHWIDSETQAFLDTLVASLTRGRVFLWVNYRPGYSHTWANKDYYSRLRLSPLPAEGANELLDTLLGDHEDLAKLKAILIKRTDGNPFFIEESVRALAESGVLVGEKGNYRPAVLIDNVRIPSTVQSVLAERVDRLPVEEKQLLQTAAVIGVVVPDRLLRAVTELAEEKLRGALANLQAGEFLQETRLFPELEYKFTHALINEVVYGELLQERRIALHVRTMAALEALAEAVPLDPIEALADHAFRGELWDKAALYLKQAGSKAMAHSAFGEALSSYERAFAALAHLNETQERLEQQIDLHLDCRNVLFLGGDLPRVGEELARAQTLAERLGDERRLARVLNFQNSYYGLIGDPERAIQAGRRALGLPVTHRDAALRAVSRYYTGVAYNKIAQYDRAAVILRSGMQSVEGELKYEQFGTAAILSVIFRSHLSQSLAMTGDFDEGLARGAEGVAIAKEANHPVSLIHINSSLGVLYIFKGDFDEAIPILEDALAICENKHIPIYVPLVAPRLGYAYVHAGRLAEGLRLLEQSIDDSAAVGRAGFLALNMAWLSEAYLMTGRIDEATSLAERAFDLSKQHKERGHGALALKLGADIARRRVPADIEQVEARYREALMLAEDMGMRPLQAHCHRGLAKVHAAAGAHDRARAEFNAALELYRTMAMISWQTRTEKSLSQISY